MFLLLNMILVPVLKLSRKRDAVLLAYTHNIIGSLTGNVLFPDLQPDVQALKAQANRFEAAMDKVRNGPAGAAALKRAERAQLEYMLKQTATKCVIIANGNETTFLSSSFELRRRPQRHDSVETPTHFDVLPQTVAGTVRVRFKKVAGAYTYELWVAKAGETFNLYRLLTAGRGTMVNGLEELCRYRFKLRAIGRDGISSGFTEIVEVPVI